MQITGLNATYQTTTTRRATHAAQNTASQPTTSGAADAGKGVSSYDFSKMSRSEMKELSQKLYEAGEISFDELTVLQLAGPLGKVGPNGEFVPFSDRERARIDSKPMNYLQMTEDALAGIESRGATNDPKSGYQTWLSVRSLLQSLQGQSSVVNFTA